MQNSISHLLLDSDEGEVYLIGERQGKVTIKVDRRNTGIESMSLLSEDIGPGDAIPVHKHGAEDEMVYIECGTGLLTFGDIEYEVKAGSIALVPKGVWHGIRNKSDELLRVVISYTPSGFEDYFRAIGVRPGDPWKGLNDEDWIRINKKYNVVYRD